MNINTDSHYVITALHMHGTIYRERHLLMVRDKDMKNSQEILNLLQAVCLSSKMVVMHCPGHQRMTQWRLEEIGQLIWLLNKLPGASSLIQLMF